MSTKVSLTGAMLMLLLACNFEFGHEVPRREVLGRIDPGEKQASFAFTTRGSATFFTLAAFDEPVVPADSVVTARIVDQAGQTLVDHRTGSALQKTNWDEPKFSVLVYPMGTPRSTLPRGQRFSIVVQIDPPTRQPVVLVHSWLSQHGE